MIAVPIDVSSGELVIGGPEEYPNKHLVKVPKVTTGWWRHRRSRATIVKRIDLYLERLPRALATSQIIVADGALHPPSVLLESVDVA